MYVFFIYVEGIIPCYFFLFSLNSVLLKYSMLHVYTVFVAPNCCLVCHDMHTTAYLSTISIMDARVVQLSLKDYPCTRFNRPFSLATCAY